LAIPEYRAYKNPPEIFNGAVRERPADWLDIRLGFEKLLNDLKSY